MFPEESIQKETERLDRLIHDMDEVRDDTNRQAKSKEGLNGMPWSIFARRMRVLTSQSSGPKLESRFIDFYHWEPVSSKLDRGDAREVRLDTEGNSVKDEAGEPIYDYYEIKASFITGRNRSANFVQLR